MMERRNSSNAQLGRAIGVSHVTIGNYLRGDMPKTDHFFAIARFFGVDAAELYSGNDESTALHDAPGAYGIDWKSRAEKAEAELSSLKAKLKSLTGS